MILPEEFIKSLPTTNGKVLDIAGTAGEFAVALHKRMSELGFDKDFIANAIYTIPKSSICYELTRKLYEMLELNPKNIAKEFIATDMLDVKVGDKIDYDKIKALLTQNKPFNTIKLTDTLTEGETEMLKFEAVVGNPPYQKNQKNTSDEQIYPFFMDLSYKLSPKACIISPAKFLFNAGNTPATWNKKMLEDKYLRVVMYEPDIKKIFTDVGFEGGLTITLRDSAVECGAIGVFSPYEELNSIREKVNEKGETSLSSIVFAPESYKFSPTIHREFSNMANRLSKGHQNDIVTNIFEKLPDIFLGQEPTDNGKYVKFYGLVSKKRACRWIRKEYISTHENLNSYKVLLPKSNGSGAIGKTVPTAIIGEPIIASPSCGHTQSFISIGAFDSENEAESLFKYVKTKFVRVLVGILKVTQDNKRGVWEHVPLQDFTANSDIDWSKSIAEIDQQLYAKYNLTEEEISFIESMIKPME